MPLDVSAGSRSPVSTPAGGRVEHVTATGWRLVGRAASLFTDALREGELPAGRDEDVLYAARFRVRPRLGAGSAVHGLLAILGTAVARQWESAPPLTRDRPVSRTPSRFHGVRWDTVGEPGAWTGELVWRHPHPVVAGAPCTTQVLMVEQGTQVELAVRVTADGGPASVRGLAGAGQARPAFLAEMNRALRLLGAGGGAGGGGDCAPRTLAEADVDRFVRDVLLSETREQPAAVLAPHEDGEYVVPPNELAEELLGLATLYVLERHPATFRLTDALGDRRLSCYFGALRVYLPEFSCADRPDDHPLLVRDRLVDPVIRATLVGRLGREAGARVVMPATVAERQTPPKASPAAPAAPRPVSAPASPPSPSEANAPSTGAEAAGALALMPPLLEGLGAQIGALSATIARLVEANAALAGEIDRLRTTSSVRAANTASLERRIQGLEELLQRTLTPAEPEDDRASATAPAALMEPEEDADEEETVSLLDVLRQAATAHTDALLVLDSAERAAADSPYEDADRVAVILDAMAGVARRRQEGALGTSLREAFRELGIDYRGGISRSTSERHRQQYLIAGPAGEAYDCREHIVLGTSYDPRYCLRIYFTSRAAVEPRFVIGHVGRHFEVGTTT